MSKTSWVEKYRPKTVDEYVFRDEDQKAQVREWIESGEIPHLLFHGPPGTGKTTLAKIIINELDIDDFDVMMMNGSKEGRKIDEFNDKLDGFTQTIPFSQYKIIFIDEADYLNLHSVQPSLRTPMVEYHHCRFILTCNYVHKIMPAIQDRCQVFKIEKQDYNEFTARVAEVLIAEEVEFDIDLLDTYVKASYPSLRKALNVVQQNTVAGKLNMPTTSEGTVEIKTEFVNLVKQGKYRQGVELLGKNIRQDEIEDMLVWCSDNVDMFADTDEHFFQANKIIRDAIVQIPSIAHPDIHITATVGDLLSIKG